VGELATVDSELVDVFHQLKVTLAETGRKVLVFSHNVEILAPSESLVSKK